MLTLGVIAAAVRWAPAGRARTLLLGALCVLTLGVLASALTRLGLYMDAFGFTPLRLAAQAAMLWIAAIFAALVVVPSGWLPRATVALTALAILAFAVSNPDRRIAERNLDRFERTGSRRRVRAPQPQRRRRAGPAGARAGARHLRPGRRWPRGLQPRPRTVLASRR